MTGGGEMRELRPCQHGHLRGLMMHAHLSSLRIAGHVAVQLANGGMT